MRKNTQKKESVSFEEFFALAEFFNTVINGEPADQSLDSKSKILLNADDYLLRGEKLVSLAKEHFKELVNKTKITEFEKLLYGVEPKDGDLCQAIAAKVIRPILRQAKIIDDKLSDTALSELLSFICFHVEISPAKSNGSSHAAYFRKNLQSGDSMLKLIIKETGYDPMVIYGLKNHTHTSCRKNVLYKAGDCVTDIAGVLSQLVVASVFINVLKDTKCDSYQDTLTEYKKQQQKLDLTIGCCLASLRIGRKDTRLSDVELMDDQAYDDACSDIWHRTWLLPEFKENDLILNSLKPLLDLHHVNVERVACSITELRKRRQKNFCDGVYKTPKDIPLIIEHDLIRYLIAYEPFEFMEIVPEAFVYHALLEKGSTGYWALPLRWGDVNELIFKVFQKEYHNKHQSVISINELKRLDSEYAKSYQTKKNIPAKTLASMEESAFNDYFGYVEFDENVDLNKIAVVTEQFVAFKETYFPKIDSSDNAIRFRRLGNHKALGLYYPSVKCLCVDINSPSSLIHEYGHLIDFCYGRLSNESSFYQIRRMYEDRIRRRMEEDKDFSGLMKSKGKYNLSYYLIPTEIFARSFELYVKEVLGVNNSLTPTVYEAVYPTDDEFIKAIELYFINTLPHLGEGNGKAAVYDKAAAVNN